MHLSARLEAIAGMVQRGAVAADIGCDHGFVPIALVQRGICGRAVASDVGSGPLERAAEHVREYGLTEKISLRQGSGLSTLKKGEADTIIMSGMGGMLMMRLLEEESEKAHAAQTLLLSPQSDLEAFRAYLVSHGYMIRAERFLMEGGKPYFILNVGQGRDERKWEDWMLAWGRERFEAFPQDGAALLTYLREYAEKKRRLYLTAGACELLRRTEMAEKRIRQLEEGSDHE